MTAAAPELPPAWFDFIDLSAGIGGLRKGFDGCCQIKCTQQPDVAIHPMFFADFPRDAEVSHGKPRQSADQQSVRSLTGAVALTSPLGTALHR